MTYFLKSLSKSCFIVIFAAACSKSGSAPEVPVGSSLDFGENNGPRVIFNGTPASTSASLMLAINVAGKDVTHYRYKVGSTASTVCSDSVGYADEKAVSIPISDNVEHLADGSITLCATGRNSSMLWQTFANASVYSWTKDTKNEIWYKDADGDGFGDPTQALPGNQPEGYVNDSSDCDDSAASLYQSLPYNFRDADGDTFFIAESGLVCTAGSLPAGYAIANTSGKVDCNDTVQAMTIGQPFYMDADGDGFGTSTTVVRCDSKSAGVANNDLDDNDSSPAVLYNQISRIKILEVTARQPSTASIFYLNSDFNKDGDHGDSLDNFNLIANPSQWLDFVRRCRLADKSSCMGRVLLLRDIEFTNGDIGTVIDEDKNAAGFLTRDRHNMLASGTDVFFTGVIEGNGYAIRGLHYDLSSTENVGGIAGRIGSGAFIRGIGFENGSVVGYDYVGGIVGNVYADGDHQDVQQVRNTGPVKATLQDWPVAGGLVGVIGTSESATSTSRSAGTLSDSYNTGPVSAIGSPVGALIGGVIGQNFGSVINTFNTGSVTVNPNQDDTFAGGIVGSMVGYVRASYNTGTVTARHAGGIAGYSGAMDPPLQSYNAGMIAGTSKYNLIARLGTPCETPLSLYYLQSDQFNAGLPTIDVTCKGLAPAIGSEAAMRNAANFPLLDFKSTGAFTILPNGGSYPYLKNVTPAALIPGKP